MEWVNLLAIFLGPLFGMQIQYWFQYKHEKKRKKDELFKILMATRATSTKGSISAAHVQALNSIDVVFYGKRKKEKAVIEAWKNFVDHLHIPTNENSVEIWASKKNELLFVLLQSMATCLNYEFETTSIRNHSYFPRCYGDKENEDAIIRKGLVGLLQNDKPLNFVMHEVTHNENRSAQGFR